MKSSRIRLLVVVFLGLHVPLTVLAISVLLLSQYGHGTMLLAALLGTVLAALVTLPVVYKLSPPGQA